MSGSDFSSRQGRPLDRVVRDPALRSAIGYWDSLRGTRLVPPRMALDPAQMRPHLQNAAILEAPQPGTVRIRLAGARINALMGMEVRGMPLRALFDLADRGRITDAAEEALAAPMALIVDARAPAPRYGVGREEEIRAQIAILPMTDNDLATTRALYVMGDIEGGMLRSGDQHRWSILGLDAIPLAANEPVVSSDRALGLAATPRALPAGTSEREPELRGAFARARFRVIQ
ncbi:MAG: PAS domain-containing protein, partial [Roseicyclus sp.]